MPVDIYGEVQRNILDEARSTIYSRSISAGAWINIVELSKHGITTEDTCRVAWSTRVQPAVKGAGTSEVGITLSLIWHSQCWEHVNQQSEVDGVAEDTCKIALSTGAEPTVKGAGTSEVGITLSLIWYS